MLEKVKTALDIISRIMGILALILSILGIGIMCLFIREEAHQAATFPSFLLWSNQEWQRAELYHKKIDSLVAYNIEKIKRHSRYLPWIGDAFRSYAIGAEISYNQTKQFVAYRAIQERREDRLTLWQGDPRY